MTWGRPEGRVIGREQHYSINRGLALSLDREDKGGYERSSLSGKRRTTTTGRVIVE